MRLRDRLRREVRELWADLSDEDAEVRRLAWALVAKLAAVFWTVVAGAYALAMTDPEEWW